MSKVISSTIRQLLVLLYEKLLCAKPERAIAIETYLGTFRLKRVSLLYVGNSLVDVLKLNR